MTGFLNRIKKEKYQCLGTQRGSKQSILCNTDAASPLYRGQVLCMMDILHLLASGSRNVTAITSVLLSPDGLLCSCIISIMFYHNHMGHNIYSLWVTKNCRYTVDIMVVNYRGSTQLHPYRDWDRDTDPKASILPTR